MKGRRVRMWDELTSTSTRHCIERTPLQTHPVIAAAAVRYNGNKAQRTLPAQVTCMSSHALPDSRSAHDCSCTEITWSPRRAGVSTGLHCLVSLTVRKPLRQQQRACARQQPSLSPLLTCTECGIQASFASPSSAMLKAALILQAVDA